MRWYSVTYDLPKHCYDGLPHGLRVLAWGPQDAKERADKALSYLCFQYDHETIKVNPYSGKATLSEIEQVADFYEKASIAWERGGRFQQTSEEYNRGMAIVQEALRRT